MIKIIKELLCIVGVIFLIKCGYHFYIEQAQSKKLPIVAKTFKTPKKSSKSEKAFKIVKKSSNALMGTLSTGLIKLGNITKKAQFKNTGTQTESAQMGDKNEQLLILKEQAGTALQHLQQDGSINVHEKNQLTGQIKEVQSQIEHIDRQVKKGPPVKDDLDGPARKSTETIHQETIERKVLALVNKMENYFTDLSIEMTGKIIEKHTSETITEGISYNNKLLESLIS